ncbi:MAG: acetolactate synthase small subunit [Candidatus Bathyarchaeia archaeon]
MEKYIVAALVEDRPGVLFKVTNLIRRRGFNIDSISVGPVDQHSISRMTIVINGDEKIIEQVVKQLRKLLEVVKIVRLNPAESVLRELALVKVHASESKARSDVMDFAEIFRARIVDASSDSLIVEITGDPEKIDAFLNLVKPYGIKEIARTGLSALARGSKSIKG